ncbi:hypothetical protein CH368_06040 [Leptospira levettii]|nr:hypothetical protein CH368_06040 [Leptospira levettii]
MIKINDSFTVTIYNPNFIPPYAKWIAIDEDYHVYWYTSRPYLNDFLFSILEDIPGPKDIRFWKNPKNSRCGYVGMAIQDKSWYWSPFTSLTRWNSPLDTPLKLKRKLDFPFFSKEVSLREK